jgi:hypothetical protein
MCYYEFAGKNFAIVKGESMKLKMVYLKWALKKVYFRSK